MAVTRCAKGHYYDSEKFSRCPLCGVQIDFGGAFSNSGSSKEERTIAFSQSEQTGGFYGDRNNYPDDEQKTIGINTDSRGNDFVTGWIVCVEGPEKGRDHRLYHGFNRIGRGYGMQISIESDPTITRKNQCAIVYDSRSNTFFLSPEEGNSVTLNGKYLTSPAEIRRGDLISIGQGTYEFVPFCREGRVWEKGE